MRTVNQKSRRRKLILGNIALLALCIVAFPAVYNYLKIFVSTDPFSSLFAKSPEDIDDSIEIRMDKVVLRDYKGAKLISRANANRIDILKDRQSVNLYGVTNGVYDGSKGHFTYSAASATWSLGAKWVTVNKSLDIHGKDLDLHAQGLTYDDRVGELRITGKVTGRLYKGHVVASTVRYNMTSGASETGAVDWTGKLDLGPQDEAQSAPRTWNIHGAHQKTTGDVSVFEKGTATDGDLILVAPIVEHNQKTDVLTANGGIQYYSAKADITADKCVVYRKEKRAVLTGHVVMYVKPKSQEDTPTKQEKLPEFKPVTPDKVVAKHLSTPPDKDTEKEMEDEIRSTKNLRDFPMVVVSAQIEYWYAKGNRHAVITGEPQGRQTLKGDEWRHLWSHQAFYDGEKETLRLVSTESKKDTIMKNSLGDNTKATEITVSTKEGDDEMDCTEPESLINTFDDEIPRDDKTKSNDKGTPPPTKGSGGSPGITVAVQPVFNQEFMATFERFSRLDVL